MAKGDYADGSSLTQLHIEIDIDDQGAVSHAGISYYIRVPSGKLHPHAITVHNTSLGEAGPELKAILQSVADEMANVAREHEGC